MTTEGGEEPKVMGFEVLKSAIVDGSAARLGRLALAGRRSIDTPNFLAVTSRGVVPHVTPDNVNKHLHTGGTYVALEDFIERPQKDLKRSPPIYAAPTTQQRPRALHSFTAMPPSIMTILGARRIPAIPSPMGNKNAAISVCTSTGFQVLTTSEYHSAIEALRPDIAIPLADLSTTTITPNSKRALRMAERTDDWLKAYFADISPASLGVATFAPIPPVSYSIQWEYISRLSEDLIPTASLSGLALYDPSLLPDMLTSYPNLSPLPRLSLSAPTTPQQILHAITLGTDAFVLPIINTISDAGIALSFTFPPPSPSTVPLNPSTGTRTLPLGIDLSSPAYKFSLAPLAPNCTCYACTAHHAAYIHHLLVAREMLGWTLLQIHNHAVMDAFFAGVRAALAQQEGETAFEDQTKAFNLVYEPDLPAGTGERPRARGYQYKSEGGDQKLNKPAWEKFEAEQQKEQNKKEPGVEVGGTGEGVETPLVPDEVEGNANELDQQGFAKVVRE